MFQMIGNRSSRKAEEFGNKEGGGGKGVFGKPREAKVLLKEKKFWKLLKLLLYKQNHKHTELAWAM